MVVDTGYYGRVAWFKHFVYKKIFNNIGEIFKKQVSFGALFKGRSKYGVIQLHVFLHV